jgi:hypothetical protein
VVSRLDWAEPLWPIGDVVSLADDAAHHALQIAAGRRVPMTGF